jgi:chorismate mutase
MQNIKITCKSSVKRCIRVLKTSITRKHNEKIIINSIFLKTVTVKKEVRKNTKAISITNEFLFNLFIKKRISYI